MIELWKDVPDFIDLEISNTGFIRKKKSKKLLLLTKTKENNYRFSGRLKTKSYTTRKIHIVVYEIFSGRKIDSTEWVRHLDGNTSNNSFDNLSCEKRYDTNPNVSCCICGIEFYIQDRFIKKKKTNNFCCSYKCRSDLLKTEYIGERNPNFRNKNTDSDGYILTGSSLGRLKLHKATICEHLGILELPNFGNLVHIHHRDCDKENNSIENLSILSASDHKWIHKNFGNASLWAFMNGKVDAETLSSWSRDAKRSKRILNMNAIEQCAQIMELKRKGMGIKEAIEIVIKPLY